MSRRWQRIEIYLRSKHVLLVHCDVMLMELVRFIQKYPISNILRRVLMPAIFAILDHLMQDNLKQTGKCLDQILLVAPPELKQTLNDIHSDYKQNLKVKLEQKRITFDDFIEAGGHIGGNDYGFK